jgi:flagellar basal body-associated protein FliL
MTIGMIAAIGWPATVIVVIVVIGVVALISTVVASNASVASEKTKGKFTEQYRELVSSYEALAHETRDLQTATQTELAELRQKVESIEHMMREVA